MGGGDQWCGEETRGEARRRGETKIKWKGEGRWGRETRVWKWKDQ